MDFAVRELAFNLSHGYCRCTPDCVKKADQIHHLLPKSKINKKKFPLFIESIFNLCPINSGCHLNSVVPKITELEAYHYEEWLRMFKDRELNGV